jgi:hypothetical protein
MEGVKIKRPIQAKQIEDIENLNLGKTIFRNHWKNKGRS